MAQRRRELTDFEWSIIEPLAAQAPLGRRDASDRRSDRDVPLRA